MLLRFYLGGSVSWKSNASLLAKHDTAIIYESNISFLQKFLRFWYQKSFFFIIIHVEFYSRNMYHSEDVTENLIT